VKPENVLFFDTPAEFRAWLETNHETADSQWVGFHKKASGRGGLTWNEAVLEALCFGWIDGQGAPIDEHSRAIRFSKRRSGSIWSTVNMRHMDNLLAAGKVSPAGIRAYEARRPDRIGVYSHDSGKADFPADLEARFRADGPAWDFWNRQPPSYRRQMTWWVISAKRDETRERRLTALISESAAGQRLNPFASSKAAAK
jgi:uncharacterized protein YdeI (YjbR/CyaY-like superfamily)